MDVKVERQLVRLPWAADSCPWVGKLRTVLPLTNRDVIRDSAVQLGLSRGVGASAVRGGHGARHTAAGLAAGEISPRPVFPCRRVRIQRDQGRGGLGHRSNMSVPLLLRFIN
jgi:hypothetical protein